MQRLKIDDCVICLSKDIKIIEQIKDFSISGETFVLAECTHCGFKFTYDPPSEEMCGSYYQSDNYISHSDTSKGLIFRLYHIVRNIMLNVKYRLLAQLNAEKSILDIGSGTGYFLNYMHKKGFKVSGIEIDEKARNYSIKKFNLKVQTPMDLMEGKTKSNFGFITLWHVLEHLYQPEHYWRKFYELLSDDGYLIIALPNNHSYDANFYNTYWAGYDVPRHVWHFNPSTIQLMASTYNFTLIDKRNMFFDPFYNAFLSEKYKLNTFGILRGSIIGLIALIKGMININYASSVIYIFKKNYPTLH